MVFHTWIKSDLTELIQVQRLTGNLFTDDNSCNVIGVIVTDGGSPVTLEGNCTGYFIRDDGMTIVVEGDIDGNRAFVTLNNGCYDIVGQFSLVIKVGNVTVGACTGYVYKSKSDIVIDPGGVVPSINDLLDRLDVLDNYTNLAEAWAVGTKGGTAVLPTDITYENNAKFYSEEMARILTNAKVINYAVCETAGQTQIKAVTVDNWRLERGSWCCIRFKYKNEAALPKLNVNGTGAKSIHYHGDTATEGDINNLDTYLVIYDGTRYQLVGMYEMGRQYDKVIGYKSIVFGENLEASGQFSQAFGRFTQARDAGTLAIGYANNDRRTETIWNNNSAYNTGDLVCVPAGTSLLPPSWDPEEEIVGGGEALRDYYFRAKLNVPAGTAPLNEYNSKINTSYWEEVPKLMFTIGNGINGETEATDYIWPYQDVTRRNAFAVDKSGNGYFDGDVYVNADAASTSGDKLVSSSELNALIGANSGLATLDSSGKVPANQLPSFVDDVLEYASLSDFPATGESGKIYLAQDTDKVYRWASNQYVIISDYVHPSYTARTGKPAGNQTPGFGETFQISQVKSDSSGHVTELTDRTVTIPNALASASAAGLMSATDKSKLDGISAGAAAIDDTAGDGDTNVGWSADKLIDEAFCLTTDTISSFPVTISDARITEECSLEDFIPDERIDIGWVTEEGKLILYGNLPEGVTLPPMKLRIHRVHGLTSDARAVTLRQQNSSSANGNYLVAEAKNLLPGVQYSWRLYSVANNTDTYVYGVGATTHYPTYSMWFQQVPRSLVDGTVYKVIVSPTLDSSDTTASNTVEFEAAEITQP